MPKFGPGTLKIGATAAQIDISCLVNGAVISSDKDEGDSRTALCGTVRAGATTYSWVLSGNMDTDFSDPDGLALLSATEYGSEQPFVFTPNTADEVTATGVLVLDPLDFGNGDDDAFGSPMTSDFEFTLIGAPVYSPTIPVGAELDALFADALDRSPKAAAAKSAADQPVGALGAPAAASSAAPATAVPAVEPLPGGAPGDVGPAPDAATEPAPVTDVPPADQVPDPTAAPAEPAAEPTTP